MNPVELGVSLPENRPVAGDCSRPIRLTGHVDHVDTATGEIRRAFTSSEQPGGVLHVRCNNRRASVCPACSATYKRDARRLVLAGLAGGKGVPDTVTGHPAWFVTLTAPSFGPVHSLDRSRFRGQFRLCHVGDPSGVLILKFDRRHIPDGRMQPSAIVV